MNRHLVAALCAAVTLVLASAPARSHITLETAEARSGSPFKAVLRVPHGCDGAATTSISIEMPEGIIAAKPMPKPGWVIDIVKGDYAKSYRFFHGTMLGKGAKRITWTNGSLPDDIYDEFVVTGFVSDAFKPGDVVPLPVTQTCASGKSVAWREVSKPGREAPKWPAPTLRIVGGGNPSPHAH